MRRRDGAAGPGSAGEASTLSDTRRAAPMATYAMADPIVNRMPWPEPAGDPQRLLSREWLLANA